MSLSEQWYQTKRAEKKKSNKQIFSGEVRTRVFTIFGEITINYQNTN